MMVRPFNLQQSWLPDGTLVWRSGEWTLIDPRPTFGDHYTIFDGWWRPATTQERRLLEHQRRQT